MASIVDVILEQARLKQRDVSGQILASGITSLSSSIVKAIEGRRRMQEKADLAADINTLRGIAATSSDPKSFLTNLSHAKFRRPAAVAPFISRTVDEMTAVKRLDLEKKSLDDRMLLQQLGLGISHMNAETNRMAVENAQARFEEQWKRSGQKFILDRITKDLYDVERGKATEDQRKRVDAYFGVKHERTIKVPDDIATQLGLEPGTEVSPAGLLSAAYQMYVANKYAEVRKKSGSPADIAALQRVGAYIDQQLGLKNGTFANALSSGNVSSIASLASTVLNQKAIGERAKASAELKRQLIEMRKKAAVQRQENIDKMNVDNRVKYALKQLDSELAPYYEPDLNNMGAVKLNVERLRAENPRLYTVYMDMQDMKYNIYRQAIREAQSQKPKVSEPISDQEIEDIYRSTGIK